MDRERVAPDSRVSDIVDTLSDPAEYVRQIIGNFVGGQYDRGKAVIRIGVAGIGVAPNYKIEYPTDLDIGGGAPVTLRAAQVYHGRNHKEIKAFANADTRDEHWSTRAMSYADLEDLFRELRAKRKKY
jgi:hypothetical protein